MESSLFHGICSYHAWNAWHRINCDKFKKYHKTENEWEGILSNTNAVRCYDTGTVPERTVPSQAQYQHNVSGIIKTYGVADVVILLRTTYVDRTWIVIHDSKLFRTTYVDRTWIVIHDSKLLRTTYVDRTWIVTQNYSVRST